MAIIAMFTYFFIPSGSTSINQSRIQTARQQALAIQNAFEQWTLSQATLADARALFNPNPAATAPVSQVAFYNTNLLPLLDSTIGPDISANSSEAQLSSTEMNIIGASATLYWDSNYTVNHPQVRLTIP